jgi:hypothetical protein
MPSQSDSTNELTPEGAEVLQGIIEDTKTLRELDLGDAPPAMVFEAE